MFGERLISSIVMLLLVVLSLVFGGYVLLAAITGISLIGLYELYRIEKLHNTLLGVIGFVVCIILDVLLYIKESQHIFLLSIVFLLALMFVYVFAYPKFTIQNIVYVFFGFFYVGVMLSYLLQVRMMEEGTFLVVLIFISAWGCDTCAYSVGMLIGKHKLVPKLSPKKSVEGAIGGVVGAALIGFIYGLIVKKYLNTIENPEILFTIICAFGGIISQVGDLTASGIKRNYNIKDYGKLIPGHGGILDRFDSIIITAPIIYIFLLFLG